ncbi:hypothetical protein BDZ94DRAFT_1193298 [Collybia nuda]|uniref:CxC2-like cysteine cluster KDZ transposase-associated domain-containing protein n=1 Tax=Collybia nuda TaxID=64659 RepID=A0A9P6CJQ9_9AGAR|nr:hypothetical protein BDZ94DRAFT_1193298 [Collybia nuda]
MPPKKRHRPDLDIYYAAQEASMPDILHRHVSFETSAGGPSHNRTSINVPGVVPVHSEMSNTLIYNLDDEIYTFAEDGFNVEGIKFNDDDEDKEDDEYPYNWMDPNFVQGHVRENAADIGNASEKDAGEKQHKRKPRLPTDIPLHHFVPKIDLFLQEMLRLEARHNFSPECSKCGIGGTILYRCTDCMDTHQLCVQCTVQSHASSPLHCVQEWAGTYWRNTYLKKLGLRIQLNHASGQQCLKPVKANDDSFIIIDTSGIHHVGVNFCDCHRVIPHSIQLLRAGFYPATTKNPRTAATFRVLNHFHILSFMSKISGFEFYAALSRLIDNTGTSPPPYRYVAFMRMVREWRHLTLLKRFGRGHDPSGVRGTKKGECAVICPACPQPGRNLPLDWEDAPVWVQWLYTLFLAIDANFRLKRLDVSNDIRDPGLNHGYAYFVEEKAFKKYLREYDDRLPVEPDSTCNNYDAMKSANSRGGKGLASSGAGTVDCSRHDMKRPVSVGDLQKGERYLNMDYFYLSSLRQNAPQRILTSFDIVCQWTIYLALRCSIYPPNLLHAFTITYLIPKFHLRAHQASCQADFSFNYTPNVGRTDGEAPERGWAAMNPVANSTKEMGPGSRRDTLDDHFGDLNWRKVTGMGATLLRRATEAAQERGNQVTAFMEFDASLPEVTTTQWTKMVQAWENDKAQLNPFKCTERRITEHAVRLELARDDASSMRSSSQVVHENMPPSLLLAQGLELEDQQRRLRIDAKALGSHSTDLQITKVIERANRLKRQIDAWSMVQLLYMPAISSLRVVDNDTDTLTAAINGKLHLPSQILDKISVPTDIMELEWRLRFAQAHDALHDIRRLLLVRSQMLAAKDRFSRGQGQVTRSRNLIIGVQARIDAHVLNYHDFRTALICLAQPLGKVGWDRELQVLHKEDIQGLSARESGRSEGRMNMSWIWRTAEGGEDFNVEGPRMQEALRIEWCRARARAHRWQEECLLLQEEMRRVKEYFSWEERLWIERAAMVTPGADPLVAEGQRAYAFRQAMVRSQLRSHCEELWKDVPEQMLKGPGLPEGPEGQIYVIECH